MADLPISPSDVERDPIQWDKVGPILKRIWDPKSIKSNDNLMLSDKEEAIETIEKPIKRQVNTEGIRRPLEESEVPMEVSKSSNDIT